MSLNPHHFHTSLANLVGQRPICIAYSGGVDSHVLLHLLSQAPRDLFPSIRAVHVNHGLHQDAGSWGEHCQQTAKQLGIELAVLTVEVSQSTELGVEAAARQARYEAIQNALSDDEILLTAQHQQDQAETLLLQLLRGAGPKGLSAMQTVTNLFGMDVIRPFLSLSQATILNYAEQHNLQWIEDPSNQDTQFNRNYIRHQIWPRLQQRWPTAETTISRAAQHCEDAAIILNDMAEFDAQSCQLSKNRLQIEQLLQLSEPRQRNVLRFVIERAQLSLPSSVKTQQILTEVCCARADAMPEVRWADVVVRRYQDILYIETDNHIAFEADWMCQITSTDEQRLSSNLTLKWKAQVGHGIKKCFIDAGLTCRFRAGGERIRLQGQQQHKLLKHLFQEWQIPPWQRASLPLLFDGEELVAIIGYGVADAYAAEAGEKAWFPYLES